MILDNSGLDEAVALARQIADEYSGYAQVTAVTLSGSRTSGVETDSRSDIDLFVYTADGEFPPDQRRAIVERLGGAFRANLGLKDWGDGDVWFAARSGVELDVVYSSQGWIEDTLDSLLGQTPTPIIYATCPWYSVLCSTILFDRTGWYAALKVRTNVPYPEGLRRALIAACFPILREIIPSYRYNVEKSLARRDLVFINNEVTWLLANYFEVIFAFNRVAHPGSKRLPAQAARLCQAIPVEMDRLVNDVLRLAGTGDPGVLGAIDRLVDGLEEMLGEEKPA